MRERPRMPASKQTKCRQLRNCRTCRLEACFRCTPRAEPGERCLPLHESGETGRGSKSARSGSFTAMGQQIPFENSGQSDRGMMSGRPKTAHRATAFAPKARSIRVGDQVLQRVELQVAGESGKNLRVAPLRAYWAAADRRRSEFARS